MKKILGEIFDEHFANVKFDSGLAKRIHNYQIWYLNKNRETLEFFGSNLLGVHIIRYTDSDINKFFNEVVDVDFEDLDQDLQNAEGVNHDWKITSDTFNLTLMYVLHRIFTTREMMDSYRKQAAFDAALLFFYRCIAALISDYFTYPADTEIVQAAYANLSNKYLIKKLGSWHKVMEYRAKDLINPSGLHYKNLVRFNNIKDINYSMSDSQGRIRDMVKNYYAEFKKVHTDGTSIGLTSGTYIDAEGSETIKEKTKSVESVITYTQNLILDKNSFIKDDLIYVIHNLNKNTSFKVLKTTLIWVCDNILNGKYKDVIQPFLKLVIIHSYHLIEKDMSVLNKRDFTNILVNLKNLYLSTRSLDKELMEIRKLGDIIIKDSSDKPKNTSLALATRTSLILYITLRAMVGH